MRYEGQLLTVAESRALIDEMERWCRRTGTNYNKIRIAARAPMSLRYGVRIQGRRVTFSVANRLRQAMQEFRHGISKAEHRARLSRISPVARHITAQEIMARRVNREPCPRCGVRADIGCPHVWNANGEGNRTAA